MKRNANDPPRILVVSQHFWPENFRISDMVTGFLENGVAVDVLCGLPNYPKGEWFPGYRYTGPRRERFGGADVFRSGEIRRKNNTSLRIFLNYCSFPVFSLFSLPRLWGRRYDAVFCYETSPVMMMLPAILYAKTHRIPLTTYVLDLWPDNLYSVLPVQNRVLRGIAGGVSGWFYRRSTRLVAMSEQLGQRLAAVVAKKKKPTPIAVIPQYSEDFYAQDICDEELRAQYAGFFTLLFTGNISPAQDLENLVDAVALLPENERAGLRCLLVGDGMSRDDLQQRIEQAGLAGTFVFCGSCPAAEIPHYTGMADALFAGLAKSDNLGLTVPAKIPTYLAAGRPLLVAADGEAARATAESGAALVSPAADAAALAANLQRLMAFSPGERAAMGAAGRRCYAAQYRREPLLRQMLDFILAP